MISLYMLVMIVLLLVCVSCIILWALANWMVYDRGEDKVELWKNITVPVVREPLIMLAIALGLAGASVPICALWIVSIPVGIIAFRMWRNQSKPPKF